MTKLKRLVLLNKILGIIKRENIRQLLLVKHRLVA